MHLLDPFTTTPNSLRKTNQSLLGDAGPILDQIEPHSKQSANNRCQPLIAFIHFWFSIMLKQWVSFVARIVTAFLLFFQNPLYSCITKNESKSLLTNTHKMNPDLSTPSCLWEKCLWCLVFTHTDHTHTWPDVVQEGRRVHWSLGWRFDPQILLSTCQSATWTQSLTHTWPNSH